MKEEQIKELASEHMLAVTRNDMPLYVKALVKDAFIEGYKANKWIDVISDIVIPNEMLLVEYHNGEHEVIFYDGLRTPNFRWYIPLTSLPCPQQ